MQFLVSEFDGFVFGGNASCTRAKFDYDVKIPNILNAIALKILNKTKLDKSIENKRFFIQKKYFWSY